MNTVGQRISYEDLDLIRSGRKDLQKKYSAWSSQYGWYDPNSISPGESIGNAESMDLWYEYAGYKEGYTEAKLKTLKESGRYKYDASRRVWVTLSTDTVMGDTYTYPDGSIVKVSDWTQAANPYNLFAPDPSAEAPYPQFSEEERNKYYLTTGGGPNPWDGEEEDIDGDGNGNGNGNGDEPPFVPKVERREYYETRPGSYLTYLMGQKGIQSGTPLSRFMQERLARAERSKMLQRSLSAQRGEFTEGIPERLSTYDYLPAYMSGTRTPVSSGTLKSLSEYMPENPFGASFFESLGAGGMLQGVAEAQTPWLSGAFGDYLSRNVYPEMYRQYEALGPTTTANKTWLQYMLGQMGGRS